MSEEYRTIKYEIIKNILSVTLNRPEKRNALNGEMVDELSDVILRFGSEDSTLGLMLTGAGDAFCAGADLAYLEELKNKSYEENLEDSNNLKNLLWNIYTYPKPTMALVNGPAVAGGCGLMTVFDMAIASDNAKFAYPEVKIGFVAALVSVFLVDCIGFRRAKYLLLSGDVINAREAENIGLVQKVVSSDELQESANTFFDHIRINSPQAVQLTKELLNKQWATQLKEFLEEASEFNAKVRQTEDFHEGLISFLHKQKPTWIK